MCGIVGISAQRPIVHHLIAGLQALEYRGYDSAGIAMLTDHGIERLRAKGKVRDLDALQKQTGLDGFSGIAHTRWATHGVPSEMNAHPHASGQVSVVHNGIIENHAELRAELMGDGFKFDSQTDTEVIAHMIERDQQQGMTLFESVKKTVARLHGAYAIVAISAREPGTLAGARLGSPLVIGYGEGENYFGSDVHALIPLTRNFSYMEEGDVAEITLHTVRICNAAGEDVSRPVKVSSFNTDAASKGDYAHYMLKEIHEQPQSIADTLEGRIAGGRILTQIFGVDADALLRATESVHIIACGASYHAGLVARYWIEQLAGVPCTAEIASEYRYRDPVVKKGTLFLTISQSGETADTLAALKLAKQRDYLTQLAICNVPESSIVREAGLVLMTRAGPEIGVASTKAFTTQLAALALFSLELARIKGVDPEIYLDGGTHWPVAMEGALKLKEISYIHAEAYAAGELKHGPLALVDKDMPVIAVAPKDALFEKLKSNLQEVRARGGELYVFADADTHIHAADGIHIMQMPEHAGYLSPILHTIPLQLLAYYVALQKGTDVDKPRNLAKSVTVE